MTLQTLKIGTRLGLGFGLLLLLLAIALGLSYRQIGSAGPHIERLMGLQQRQEMAQDWRTQVQLNLTRTEAVARAGGAGPVAEHFAPLIKATSARITELQDGLNRRPTPRPTRRRWPGSPRPAKPMSSSATRCSAGSRPVMRARPCSCWSPACVRLRTPTSA